MRGEYLHRVDTTYTLMELPPHARRILTWAVSAWAEMGTTSACAENTDTHTHRWRTTRNYLRMRGEYCVFLTIYYQYTELPPHARRILYHI